VFAFYKLTCFLVKNREFFRVKRHFDLLDLFSLLGKPLFCKSLLFICHAFLFLHRKIVQLSLLFLKSLVNKCATREKALSTCAALRTTLYASRDLFLSCSIVLFAQGGEVAGRLLGPDDEIGILNTLTAAQRSAVLQQVAIGKVYNLSVDYFVGMPGLVALGMEDLTYHMWLTHPRAGQGRKARTGCQYAGACAL
jgi:hypothetical protein